MKKSGSLGLVLFLLGVVALLGLTPFLKGAFYLGKHEGDTLHMAEIVLRMARGEWPHLDFMTPIGMLAMAPIALFVAFGVTMGKAIFLAQLMVALLLLPVTAYVAQSRVVPAAGRVVGWAYGAFVMILCLALVHGEAEPAISISMHYNRWAWAVAYLMVPLVILEPQGRQRPALDGALIGLSMAALALTKATYAVSLAPVMIVGLLVRRWWRVTIWALVAGLVVMGLVTLMAGPGIWPAYLGDLLTVARSDVRPQPGKSLEGVTTYPAYLAGTMTLLAAVMFLRQAGRMTEGLLLLILAPGLIYITYQNYGNDPQWMVLLAMLAATLRPAEGVRNARGWDLRKALGMAALAALAFGLPSVLNLTYSPLRLLGASTEKRVPLTSARPEMADILTTGDRIYAVLQTRDGDGPGSPLAAYARYADREKELASVNGEALPYCEMVSGTSAWSETVAADLTAAGYAGKRIVATDVFSNFWLFGDFPPVKGSAPWYYDDLSGFENADYILVPLCAVSLRIRADVVRTLNERGIVLTEVRRTPLYLLMSAKKAS
jgi:hypothetical protein